jgi:hypothetical protein
VDKADAGVVEHDQRRPGGTLQAGFARAADGGTAPGVKHAGHIACGNKMPLGNVIPTITEKMGVLVEDPT